MKQEELQEIMGVPFEEVTLDAVSPALFDIEEWLEQIRHWGLNPGNVSLRDFEVAAVLTTPAPTPFPFISAGPQLVFRSKKTGAVSVHSAYPPARGRQLPMFHFATANALVGLSA